MPDGRGAGGISGKDEEIKKYKWKLQNSQRDVKYSIGNIVNNILITMYGVRWIQDLLGGSLSKLHNI